MNRVICFSGRIWKVENRIFYERIVTTENTMRVEVFVEERVLNSRGREGH